ncbi:Serine/threonine-protein phosphatase 7 long form [Glycine max]|nr:Serine/threonine-protein phosphatase 7 long form [Glycine max]
MRAILSKKTDSWRVTQWGGPHTCLNMTMTQDHEKLDSDLIVTCVVGMIREDPSIKVSLIQERINSEFAYKVSYKKVWLAKQKAIALEYGDWEESYAKLSSWLTHMQNHSPGSYFQILHDDFIVGNTVSREHRQFYIVFWTFGQCKEAFKFCKPIIQVVGTHLYGKYRGTLLMATSQDGNGGVFPLAFAVVEGETLTTWSWFLAHLREHVTDKNGICLIFHCHASIKSAVANEALGWQPPHSYHVYCARHIASNFNRKFNNAKQKEMLKKLGYTPCKHIFDQNLEKFRQLSPAIATWIDRISKEKWTMAYDREGRRYGHMITNLSECINKVLKDCRNIPITALVKSTYSRCRKYFVDRGRQAQRQLNEGQVYCYKLVKELRKNQEQACSHIVRVYDIHSTRFEVEETFNPITQRDGQKWTVNLNDHYCQCRKYFALHYPCSHIIAACVYSAQWWPLGNEATIPPSNDAWTLIPDPTTIRAKGRPKSTRIRNEMDWVKPSKHRQKCSRCGAKGHNKLTMASSSSSSSHINIKFGPIDVDVLWMQPKHVSEHVWNGEEDRKLHIKRAVPTYQGEEQIPEQIFPFLLQSGFAWIIKMGYLKINVSLISALIERWRPETHTFHMRCGEYTITLQDVSVLLGISVDGLPLIGPTNLDWADLCEELLGVRPQEDEIKGSVIKLSWLAHHFAQINNDDDEEQVRRFARAWILRFIGGVLFVNKSSNKVSLRYLQFLRDFEECGRYAWGAAVLGFLYREMCNATDYKTKSIGGMCILLQMWTWERCPTLALKRTFITSIKYFCDDLRTDTDTSVKDTEKMLVACNTFHGHASQFVGKILAPQQPLFVCQNPEFQHLTEACENLVVEIDALMLDHVPQAQ